MPAYDCKTGGCPCNKTNSMPTRHTALQVPNANRMKMHHCGDLSYFE